MHKFFNQEWPGVVRSKGFFWIASRPDYVGEVSQAGAFVRHKGIGRWWDAVPKERWPEGVEFDEMVKKYWDSDYGDRRQEIVFIGLNAEMDKDSITQHLDSCLVDDFLKSQKSYQKMNDPFPQWFKEPA